jgi:Rrf2 family nitric oxide-sensitive transcriptional repressor
MMKKNSLIFREHDYALRIAAYLASLKEGQIANVKQIATTLHISKNYASRIIHKLKTANITSAKQGKFGGVFLKADSSEITIWDVITAVGFNIRLNDCMNEDFYCDLQFGCKFHAFFLAQEQLLFENLKSQKISDYKFKQLG